MIIEFIRKGGIIIIPIIFCSIVMAAIIIERYIRLARARKTSIEEVFRKIQPLLMKSEYAAAHKSLSATPGIIPSVVRSGLASAPVREAAALAMHTAATRETGRLENFIEALSTIATIAPMLGLLGTVAGIIRSFFHIANSAGGQVSPTLLADGIWESLIATAAGLAVAIPAFIFYRALSGAIDRLAEESMIAGNMLLEHIIRNDGEN